MLLVVYVASQMASTLFMATTVDKMQRYLFMVMPLVFVFVIAHFPAGLVLYWVTTNLWTVGQGLITRRLVPKTAAPMVEKKSSRTPPTRRRRKLGQRREGRPGPAEAEAPASTAPPRKVRRKKKAGGRR